MAYGKTIEMNNIPGPMIYRTEIVNGVRIRGMAIAPMFRPNRQAERNTFDGLVLLQTISDYNRDVRNALSMPNPSLYRKNKISRKLSKISRRMRKYNLINA